ncbi:5'-nucleotidase C-terminal domain-containing protein [Entomospira entomophila]|uniref:Bifunctional metallophosphatase/5'-nucleotidase n=1 Tax=Entomospira entomophila TaxID=2719988 RepID=A0A968KVP3_9SPIO|nr:5'-nucleotidase C-terminal domain-containing protein [Entomospira entomophilus]NIZ40050.1 hypothetical protein [Entomospira entomophilus]WDI35611.1 5'-nucleotidase C-terminal domain-containing protein [Entomospira entomophilus]
MKDHKDDIIEIQILHTADIHGRFIKYDYALDEISSKGSLASIVTKVKELRRLYPHTYLIDTGDTFQGNYNELFQSCIEENPMTLLMNHLEYDTFTLGNHEFNYGIDYVYRIMGALKMPTLAANLYTKEGLRFAKPYVIFNQSGIRIAIVGMVTPNIMRWDSDHLGDVVVRTPLEEMASLWPELEGRADLYIFANHQSFHDFYMLGDGYEQLIKKYPQFRLALISHSHQKRATLYQDTWCVQPGVHGSDLGQVIFRFKKSEHGYEYLSSEARLIPMTDVPEDSESLALVESAHKEALEDIRVSVGRLVGGNLVPKPTIKKMSQAQIECTPLIAFINDVQRYYGCADVSLTTLSHLDANLIEGEINRADIVNMYRHNNILRVYRICGWQLKQLMEWSARYFNQWKEGDLTISFEAQIPVYDYAMFGGVLYDINIAQPVGNRIERLRWPDGRSVQMNESLTVAIDDFKAKGFLEKDLFAKDSSVQLIKDFTSGYQGDGRIRNLIIQYIQEHAQGIINNEINSKDNDFRLVGYDWDETLHQEAVRQLNEGIIPISESENSLSYHTQSIRREDLR